MSKTCYLHVGGVVAMGFDPLGEFLLVVSHSGSGLYSTKTWERVARDREGPYPNDGFAIGIGPVEGQQIAVTGLNYATDMLNLSSSDGSIRLEYECGTITVHESQASASP